MKKVYSLFKTNNHYYIYDANIDKVSKLSPRLYQLILNESEFQNDQEYDNLCKKGFFQSSKLNLAKRPETDVIDDFYKRKLGNVIFQTTQNCNLRCAYCPYSQSNMNNRNHNILNMPLNTAKKVLDFIHMHSVDRENISIGFYGGEPLLNFDLIKNIVNYANNIFLGKELIYSITTNLTVITDEMLRFFEDNKFEIMVSLDGAKESNDKNRKYYSKKKKCF